MVTPHYLFQRKNKNTAHTKPQVYDTLALEIIVAPQAQFNGVVVTDFGIMLLSAKTHVAAREQAHDAIYSHEDTAARTIHVPRLIVCSRRDRARAR